MLTILMFLGQALVCSLLTLTRTVGSAILGLYFLIGALLFFFRWSLFLILQGDGLTYLDVFVISAVDVLFLLLPTYWLLFKSSAGHGTNLMDGLALSAFLGIGYGFNYFLHLSIPFGEPSFLGWTMGSIHSNYPTIVPATEQYVVWSGYTIWGAFVGFGLALARVLRTHVGASFCWLAATLSSLLVFLEVLVFSFFHTGLIGQDTIWRSIAEWFYWLDSSGRQAQLFLPLFYLLSFVAGEYMLLSHLPSVHQFLLKRERRKPTFLSEFGTRVIALRMGVLAYAEVSSFFRSRRRLVGLLTEQHWSLGASPELSHGILRAEDQVAAKSLRAEAALAGETVTADDARLSIRQTAQKFASGLLLTLSVTGLYIFFVTWLGRWISASSGSDLRGYIYATVLVTALAYTMAYFREQIVSWFLSSMRMVRKTECLKEKGLQK